MCVLWRVPVPVVVVADVGTHGYTSGMVGAMLSDVDSCHGSCDVLTGTATSSVKADDDPVSLDVVVEDVTPKPRVKRARMAEAPPLRRSRRIAERSAIAGTRASSLPK